MGLLALTLAASVGCNLLKKKAPEPEPVAAEQADAEVVPAIPEPDGGLAEPTTEAGESTAAADAILEQMKTGGLTVDGEFKKSGAKWGAKNCTEGKIDTIPTILCEYADADLAKAAEKENKPADYASGASTGVFARNGKTILACKATKDLDKNNDKVNKIVTAFNKAK
jgi:hypothetical protein